MHKPLALCILGASAIALLVLAPGALAGEPDNDYSTATALLPGLNGPFDIDPAGDQDWFVFTLTERMNVRLETNGSGDTTLTLYDGNVSYLYYDDDGGSGVLSRINLILDTGTYYAVVEALGSFSTFYDYYLTLDAQAPLPLAEGIQGPYNLNSTNVTNWFSFDVAETSQTRIELNGTSGDPVMYLFDVNQSQLDRDDDGGVGLWSRIDMRLTPGQYFVRVQALSSGSDVVDYYITLERVSLAGPDGNGVIENATALTLGLNGPFDIDPVGDLDYYVISFGGQGVVIFQTDGASGSTLITLYDQNGSWLAQDYASGNASFSWLAATIEAQTYYLLVQDPYSYLTLYNYTVQVDLLPIPPPDYNDNEAAAEPVGVGQSGPFNLVRNDQDWYVFQADQPGTIRAETDGPHGGAMVTIEDDTGSILGYGYGTGNFSFQYASALVDAGTYLIHVQLPYGILATLEYNLSITFTPWVSVDDNDFRTQAQRLAPGLNGPFAIQPAADADWYFFEQTETGTVTIQILGGQGQATEELYNATNVFYGGGTYGVQQISSNLALGRYFVKLSSAYGYYTVSSYWLNLTLPDSIDPPIAITGPTNGTQVDNGAVRISGQTEPGAQVWVNGEKVVVDVNGSFSTVLFVALGQNAITVISTDAAGNQGITVVTVVGIDRQESLQNQLNAKNAELAAAQAQLTSAQAASAAAAVQLGTANTTIQAQQSQLDTQNGTLAATRAEVDAQRGAAFGAMLLAGLGFAAAIGIAVMMRRKPPQAPTQVYSPIAPAPVVTATVAAPPSAPVTPPAPTAPPAPPQA